MEEPSGIRCSFCAKGSEEAAVLITQPGAAICDTCIVLCYTVLAERIEGLFALKRLPEDVFIPLRELEHSGLSAADLLRATGLPQGQSAAWWLAGIWRAVQQFLAPRQKRRVLEWQIRELVRQREKQSNRTKRSRTKRRIDHLKAELAKLP